MRIMNCILFIVLFVLLFLWIGRNKFKVKGRWILYLEKNIWIVIIMFFSNILSFSVLIKNEQDGNSIRREDYFGQEQEINLVLKKGEEQWPFTFFVEPRKYQELERKEKMQEAFKQLEANMKGENASLLHITKDLNFQLDPTIYPFLLQVIPESYALMDEDGVIRNEESYLLEAGFSKQEIKDGIPCSFTIELSYGEEKMERTYNILIFEKEKTSLEEEFLKVEDEIEQIQKKTICEPSFELPTKINGIIVEQEQQNGSRAFQILVFGGIFSIILVLREKEKTRTLEKEREQKLKLCYPWFVNEMVLLFGAGMQVKHIFYKLIEEYEEDCERGEDEREPLIKELMVAKNHFETGMSEQQVYYHLGRRLKLSCYIKLMTRLEQNVKKGTRGMITYFEQEEQEALEERKNLARRYGEEAGTKLLGPMMLQLLVVMLMIMIPACMSF